MTCPDCGGDCQAILGAVREILQLPVRCGLCGAPEPEVKTHQFGDERYCFHCAQELFS